MKLSRITIEKTILNRFPCLKNVRYTDSYIYLKRNGVSTHTISGFRKHLEKMFKDGPELNFYIKALEGRLDE